MRLGNRRRREGGQEGEGEGERGGGGRGIGEGRGIEMICVRQYLKHLSGMILWIE